MWRQVTPMRWDSCGGPSSIDDTPEDYKMLVHIFGAKSSPCCANKALSMTAQDNERKYPPEVIRTVRRNFYVDDVLKSVPSTEQAVHLTSDLAKLLRKEASASQSLRAIAERYCNLSRQSWEQIHYLTWILISYRWSEHWVCTGMRSLTPSSLKPYKRRSRPLSEGCFPQWARCLIR